MKKIHLPKDEKEHKNQAIEWWYFNGFLKGKQDYAFMHCLFSADKEKLGLDFIKTPFKKIYFSHSVLYDLKNKKTIKEILPFVLVDPCKKKGLCMNYFYPIKRHFYDYEISRTLGKLRIKNKFMDLFMREKKKVLLENGSGFIKYGKESTYYYSFPNLEIHGEINGKKVSGKAWHDRQWSSNGSLNDYWTWFSIQLENNTEIFCFQYKTKLLATISYPDNSQETVEPEILSLGNSWKSPRTNLEYTLNWRIRVKDFVFETSPLIKDCEMNFGTINYWEGPIKIKSNISARGFMEIVPKEKSSRINDLKRAFKFIGELPEDFWNEIES